MTKQMLNTALAVAAALVLGACSSLSSAPAPAPQPQAEQAAAPPKVREPVVALVLGGGGVKGFAHVGVIKVLEAQGIRPSIVVGTSAGSFVGALYASGMNAYGLQRVALGMQEADIRDLTLSSQGFLVGEKLQQFVNTQVKNKAIQDFPIRFAAVATDLESGEKVAFNFGNAGQAVRASCSIPNVFLPTRIGKRQYVDGGLVSPVPVMTARDMGADVVIAVDISARPKQGAGALGWWGLLDQSINILSQQAIRAELAQADVVIQPSVQHADALNLDQRHEFLLEGEKVAHQALGRIKEAISGSKQRLIAQAQAEARL
ncbi:patatin-like phospholipase family protein [Limnobacter sp.]|uniref:patatin-like phospholipase family protein n=1 Tax=Limnobacter sp. TaxID=2003368 RepID=UPI0035134066